MVLRKHFRPGEVLPAPYAQFAAVAATVTNGAIMNAQLAGNAVNGTNIASGQVVKTLNGLTDAVSLSAGPNVTLTTNGTALQISAASGGGGGTIAAGNNVSLFTNGGVLQISAMVSSVAMFGSSGTFVVPTNVTKITVEAWGGGGGGGNGYAYTNSSAFIFNGGGGGGAGGYAWNVFSVTPGGSYTVTVGSGGSAGVAGGTSSFGALISAGGGSPGGDASSSVAGSGGLPGTTTGNLIPVIAGVGQSGFTSSMLGVGGVGSGGNGGSAFRGGNGGWGNQDQKDGESPGGGGGGGIGYNGVQGGAGGKGAQGGVAVYY